LPGGSHGAPRRARRAPWRYRSGRAGRSRFRSGAAGSRRCAGRDAGRLDGGLSRVACGRRARRGSSRNGRPPPRCPMAVLRDGAVVRFALGGAGDPGDQPGSRERPIPGAVGLRRGQKRRRYSRLRHKSLAPQRSEATTLGRSRDPQYAAAPPVPRCPLRPRSRRRSATHARLCNGARQRLRAAFSATPETPSRRSSSASASSIDAPDAASITTRW
jgi:hypothetical protein